MYSFSFDFEKKTPLTEEALNMATDAFVEEARSAGMMCTKIDTDVVTIAHDDVNKLMSFVRSLDIIVE